MCEKNPEKEQERKGSESTCDLDSVFVDDLFPLACSEKTKQFPRLFFKYWGLNLGMVFLVSKMAQTMS